MMTCQHVSSRKVWLGSMSHAFVLTYMSAGLGCKSSMPSSARFYRILYSWRCPVIEPINRDVAMGVLLCKRCMTHVLSLA